MNATGSDKILPVVIGKSKRPRCFGKTFDPNLLLHYYYNTKAWMTGTVFEDWMMKWNNKLKKAGRNVLLLLDNASSHVIPDSLSNITIHFLPANTTSHLQPLDAGIIRSFKCKYRKEQVRIYLDMLEKEGKLSKLTVKDALYMCMSAWKAVTTDTIQNCWRSVDIMADEQGYEDQHEELDEDQQQDLDKLKPALGGNIMSADDFCDIDKEVETGKSLGEDDIVALVTSTSDDSADTSAIDEYDPAPHVVTASEAKRGLSDAIAFIEQQQWCEGGMLLWLRDLEKKINSAYVSQLRQTSIEDYFKEQ